MRVFIALTWALFCACVAISEAISDEYEWGIVPVWTPGVVYKYEVHTRTVAGMTPPPSQLNGMVTRAVLLVQTDPRSPRLLKVKVAEAQYSRLHTRMAGTWDAVLPLKELSWRVLSFKNPLFSMSLRRGQIDRFLVSQDSPLRDINIMRAWASAFQFSFPHNPVTWGSTAALKSDTVLEESPMGKCYTRIDVSALPSYVVQSTPSLAPVLVSDTKNDSQFIQIVKSINFDKCMQIPFEWIPGGSAKSYERGPVTRASTTRAVFGGRPNHFEIQSVTATSRVAAGTLLRDDGRESVVWGGVNITLVSKDAHPHEDVPLLRNPMNASLIVNGPMGNTKNIYGSELQVGVNQTDGRPKDDLSGADGEAAVGTGASAGADNDLVNDGGPDAPSQVSPGAGELGSISGRVASLYSRVIEEYLKEVESNRARYAHPPYSTMSKSRAELEEEKKYYDLIKTKPYGKTLASKRRRSKKWRHESAYLLLKGNSGYNLILENILELADKHPEDVSTHIRSFLENNGGFQKKTDSRNAYESQHLNPSPSQTRVAWPEWKFGGHQLPGYFFLKHFAKPSGHYEQPPERVLKSSNIITNWDDMEKIWHHTFRQQRQNTVEQQDNSKSEVESRQLQVSAEEQRYRDKLDFQTIVLLATDPEFAGAREICPNLVIVQTALQVADDEAHPNQLVRQRALQRFGELARMVRGCTQAFLRVIGTELRRTDTLRGRNAWKAFRDATAAAGTGASLVALSTWLRTGAVRGWEARQLLATVRAAAREPSIDFLKYFKEYIAWHDDVKKMNGVNTTAILTLGSLMYDHGDRMPPLPMLYLVSDFVSEMYTSVTSGDRQRLQVYARGLGLTGDYVVPYVFAPYFEGTLPNITTYTRVALVFAMQRLAAQQDEVTQQLLFNLYENVGEAYEVRVAAVYILMCSNPPLHVLQRMAATAHLEPSNQVSAAVRTVLQAAAQLKQPQHRELARKSRAVLHTLLRRTQSLHYSRSYLKDYFVFGEKGMGYSLVFNYIGSYDSILPKMVYFGLNSYLGGLNLGNNEFAIAMSSISKLISTLIGPNSDKDQGRVPGPKEESYPYDMPPVTDFGPRIDEPLEGHVYFPFPGGPQFVNFNEDTVLTAATDLTSTALQYFFGEEFHNSKLFYGPRYSLSIPDITGHITFFNIDEINLLRASGDASRTTELVTRKKSNGREENYKMSGMKFDLNLTQANTMMSRLGFVCFYEGEPQRILAAYDQESMINIPINITGGIYADESQVAHYVLRMQPWSENNQTLLHFKGTPYTARQSPDAQGPDHVKEALLVSARDQQEHVSNFGPSGGFRFNLTSEAEFLDAVKCAKDRAGYDPMALLFLPVARPQLEPLEITVTFDPRKAKFKGVDLDVHFVANEGATPLATPPGAPQQPSARSRTSDPKALGYRNRKTEIGVFMYFYNKTTSHIFRSEYKADFREKNENLGLHYFYKEFDDNQKTETHVRRKPDQQVHLTINSVWGSSPRWIFEEALAANPTSTINAELLYEDSQQNQMDIDIQCLLRRSPERVHYLSSDRTSVLCRQQMERGDLFQPACLNVTLRAGYLNHYHCAAEYDRLDPNFMNLTAAVYAKARQLFQPHVHENPLYRGEAGLASAVVEFADGFHAVNVSVSSPVFAAHFENLRMTRQVRPFVVVHPEYDYMQRVAQYLLVYENEPKCVLDKTTVNTFDNTTYNIHLGPCWHNMSILNMQDDGNMTIQARDIGEDRILRVLLPEGGELELRKLKRIIRTSDYERSASLYVNNNLVIIFQDSPLSFDIQSGGFHNIVEISLITGYLFQVKLKNYDVRILYDGVRILAYVPNSLRGQALGLCGTFTGEPNDDFKDPDGLFQRNPRLFAASYADVRYQCEGHAKSDNALSKQVPRFPEQILVFSVSDDLYERSAAGESSEQPERRCQLQYVDVANNGSAYCFSQTTLPRCDRPCMAAEYETVSVNYHCVAGRSARLWKSLIDRGSKPDFSRKPTSIVLTKNVPKGCVFHASRPRSMVSSLPTW